MAHEAAPDSAFLRHLVAIFHIAVDSQVEPGKCSQ